MRDDTDVDGLRAQLAEAMELLAKAQRYRCEGDYCGGCIECGGQGGVCEPDCRLAKVLQGEG